MPLFCNAPIHIRRSKNYRAGSYLFRDPLEKAAEIVVGENFTKEVGSCDLKAGKIYDDYGIDYHNNEATLCLKVRPKSGPPYNSISMVLYADRGSLILVPKKDARYVEEMSGGGYTQGQRKYDSIVVKSRCTYARALVIHQRNSAEPKIGVGDKLYIANRNGVLEIALDRENLDSVMEKYGLSQALEKWEQI